jgi:hypothetical protein
MLRSRLACAAPAEEEWRRGADGGSGEQTGEIETGGERDGWVGGEEGDTPSIPNKKQSKD